MKYTSSRVQELGSILGIWAHPDDEVWAMGGIIKTACQNAQPVTIITATHGEAGQTADEARWPQAKLKSIRSQELKASLAELGNVEHHWLDYQDNQLITADRSQLIKQLEQYIAKIKPDSIFTFEENGLTGHDDHRTISQLTIKAAQNLNQKLTVFGAIESSEQYHAVCQDCPSILGDIYFNTPRPNTVKQSKTDICYHLPDDVKTAKQLALRQQASQTEQLFTNREGHGFIKQRLDCECFIKLWAYSTSA